MPKTFSSFILPNSSLLFPPPGQLRRYAVSFFFYGVLVTAEEFKQQLAQTLQYQKPKEAFYRLSDLYFVGSAEQREQIRDDFDFERKWEVPDCLTLAAHLTSEPDRELRIRAALISLSLLPMGGDDRDIVVALGPIYHSIKAIGKDADAWFRFFADISSPHIASHLGRFAARKPEDKSLATFLLESDVTEQGLVFKRTA